MKKTIFYELLLLISVGTFSTMNASDKKPKTTISKEMPSEIKVMLNRLEAIKEIDKSDLSRAEKKELREETRAIKTAVRSSGNGIYISATAIIIILILIILL
jgi:hypothetical protein